MDFAVFLKPFGNNLILAFLATALALWAAPRADATIIVCESQLSAEAGFGDELGAWLGGDPVAAAGEMVLGGMTGLPPMPTDQEREQEAQKDRLVKILHGSLMTDHSGMSHSPTNLLVQLTGAGGGIALSSGTITPPEAELRASLPPEARMILPTGPPYRWFRPPREVAALFR